MLVKTVRHCFAVDLRDSPELIERYREWHRPGGPPEAVTQSIREAGIIDLEIWLTGPRLFMIMEAGPDYDPKTKAERDASDPDIIAWETLMWEFQQALPWAAPNEKWVAATRIYHLEQ